LKDLFTTVSGGVGVDIVGGIGHEADVAIAENEIFSAKTKSVPKLDSPHPSWLFKKFRFAYFRCWIIWLFPEYPARKNNRICRALHDLARTHGASSIVQDKNRRFHREKN
jgi:hypothetical protein